MRGPSNERKMPNSVADEEGVSGGRVRARAAENLACILGTRFKPGHARPGLKRKKGVRGACGGGGYVGFTRGFRLLPDRKNKLASSRSGFARCLLLAS